MCKQELFEESITELEKADALLPDNPKISQLLGWAIYMNGNPKKGRGLLIKALKQIPGDVSILCDLAVLENQQEDDEKAEEYAVEAIKKDPNNPMAQDVLQNIMRFSKLRKLIKEKHSVN